MIHKFLFVYILSFIIAIGSVLASDWQNAHMLHMPRGGAAVVQWGHYLFTFGGKAKNNKALKSVEKYDVLADTWDKNTVPSFMHGRYNAGAIVYQDKIYLIGGRDESEALKEVEVYDPVQNSWSVAHDLHEEREGLAVHILNGQLHAIGGRDEEYSMVSDIEWYDGIEDEWKKSSWEMDNPRAEFFSAVYQNILYQFGGYYYGLTGKSYKAVPSQNGYTWQNMHEMTTGRAYGTTLIRDDKIYLIGGETSGGKSARVEVYDISHDTYGTETSLPTARSGMAGAVVGDTIFVIGGFEGNNDTPVAKVEFLVLDASPITEESNPVRPASHLLIRGYPNPFNGIISLMVKIPRQDEYRLDIFDISGRLIKTLFKGNLNRGTRNFKWDARDNHLQTVASGIYFLRIHSEKEIQKLKIIYVR